MNSPARRPAAPDGHRHDGGAADGTGHGGHGGWAMLLCCIPMVIAIVAVIAGR